MKKAPIASSGIVAFYLLLMLVAGLPGALLHIPYLDVILTALVTPFGAMAIVSCGRDISLNNSIPTIFSCYGEGWKNRSVRSKLLILGLIYGICVILIGYIFNLLSADSFAKMFNKQGEIVPDMVAANIPWAGLIFGFVLYTALLCVTCFSPMLIAWKKMPLSKAFFFSLFVCIKNAGAFIVLGLLLVSIAILGTTALSALGAIIGADSILVVIWGLVMTCWSYCTLWPIWKSVFGTEDCYV